MLNSRILVIYPSIFVVLLIGVFILIPAVAQQKEDGVARVMMDDGEGEEIKTIMKALQDREQELMRREEALKREEERLNMIKSSIEQSLKQYSAMRNKLQKEIEANSGKNEQSTGGMGRLAKIYESMSPDEAAQRIEKMDNDMAVELLSKIKNKQAGKIMESISPDKAAFLTRKLAEGRGVK